MVVAKMHLIVTIRATRVGPATILAPGREMSVGDWELVTSSKGPCSLPSHSLINSILLIGCDQHKT